MKGRKLRISLRTREGLLGYLFTLPFILGFILMFLYPFVQSIIFSLSRLEITTTGYDLIPVGVENYHRALFVNAEYPRHLLETALTMGRDVPLILIFSFFAAILLNQKFKGRLAARVIFFLPVILGADIILKMESADYMTALLDGTVDQQMLGLISRGELRELLMHLKLPEVLLLYIIQGAERLAEIIRSSGIQILIILAGLQSIPPSLYEVAEIEGATGWENFWKITLPLLSPLILTCVIYTIVDFFTSPTNPLVEFIDSYAFGGAGYGISMAMSWVYFTMVALVLAIVGGIISRRVFYMN